MGKSKIEWTEETWNPVTGCTKISAGCTNCYAEKMAIRLKAMGQKKYRNGFAVTTHVDELHRSFKSKMIFVCSMGDLFHNDVYPEFQKKVFEVMINNSSHIFQVLTKRPENMMKFFEWQKSDMPPECRSHVWIGTTVENKTMAKERIPFLLQIPSKVRFVSCEPLLSEIDLMLDETGRHPDYDWVIAGGESGPGARPMYPDF